MEKNVLYTGDNLHFLHRFNSESVDLIYLDPPFNSKRTYSAPIGSKAAGSSFKDMWSWNDIDEELLETLFITHPCLVDFIKSIKGTHGKPMMAYVLYMAVRLKEMHRILKSTGTIYLHIDPTASHYLKIVMDKIFGRDNFRNEIVWCYRGAAYPKKDFGRRHDIILRYCKSKNFIFNLDDVRGEYAGATKERFKHYIGNVRGKGSYGQQTLNPKGRCPDDWWQIQPIAPSAKERTGYPTQKPLALLDRIIKASSNEGDIVLDPFCGCATTCVAAQNLNRKWIGIDIEKKAVEVLMERLKKGNTENDELQPEYNKGIDDIFFSHDFIHTHQLPERTDVEIIEESAQVDLKKDLFESQNGKCNGCGTEFQIHNFEMDHIVPKSKGGSDVQENFQLLCGNCNRIKGNRPMEYLRRKIALRDELLALQITFDK